MSSTVDFRWVLLSTPYFNIHLYLDLCFFFVFFQQRPPRLFTVDIRHSNGRADIRRRLVECDALGFKYSSNAVDVIVVVTDEAKEKDLLMSDSQTIACCLLVRDVQVVVILFLFIFPLLYDDDVIIHASSFFVVLFLYRFPTSTFACRLIILRTGT
jgi:hypothetical protein